MELDIGTVKSSLQELLLCNVCLEPVENQKLLPCQHTVCLACIKGMMRANTKLKCPLCSKECIIPNDGVDGLPDSLLTGQIVQFLESKFGPSKDEEAASKKKSGQVVRKKTPKGRLAKSAKDGREMKSLAVNSLNDVKRHVGLLKKSLKTAVAMKDEISKVTTSTIKAIENRCKQEIEARKAAEKLATTEIEETISKIRAVVSEVEAVLENHRNETTDHLELLERYEALSAARKKLGDVRDFDLQELKRGDAVRLIQPFFGQRNFKALLSNNIKPESVGIYMGSRSCLFKSTRNGEKRKTIDVHWVIFPECPNWIGEKRDLIKTSAKPSLPYIGETVRIKDNAKSLESRSSYSYSTSTSVTAPPGTKGILKDIKLSDNRAVQVDVELPNKKVWRGRYGDIEIHNGSEFEKGDKVRPNSTKRQPSMGWQGTNGSSVGTVTSVEKNEGSMNQVVVNFPECSEWKGTVEDIELTRTPIEGDDVQVKLSVSQPVMRWGNLTHEDVGSVRNIKFNKQLEETIAEVKFPGSDVMHSFLLSEIELPRFGKNSSARSADDYMSSSYHNSNRITVEATSDDEESYYLADDNNYYDGCQVS